MANSFNIRRICTVCGFGTNDTRIQKCLFHPAENLVFVPNLSPKFVLGLIAKFAKERGGERYGKIDPSATD